MEKSLLIKLLGENPMFKIIDFLIENKDIELTKKDIIEGSRISRASLFKVWAQLEANDLVIAKRKFGKTKLYVLNSKNPIVKKLLGLESALIQKSLETHNSIEIPAQ